jgi:tRNA(Leu) C34 or U34 (ribose-2'-O)-methylase TrmL
MKDKNGIEIKQGNIVRFYREGYHLIDQISYELEKELQKKGNKPLIDLNNLEKSETTQGQIIYYILDNNGNRTKWVNDYEKEVFLIEDKLYFGFEGGGIPLEILEEKDLKVLK